MSYTSPADGEIIVQLCKGNKNVLSTQCKYYYKEFVNIKCERPIALYRWEEMYYYADLDWPVLFKIPYKAARETDVQSLQFKIINRCIPCKENLGAMRSAASSYAAMRVVAGSRLILVIA